MLGIEGLQAIAIALGGSLRALHLAHAQRLPAGAIHVCAHAFTLLQSLTIAGLTVNRADLEAVAALPRLCRRAV